MGKDWDKAVPPVAIWRECLRVLKPGAFAFVMSGPRMDCLSEMGKRLAEAGFETGFTPIFWAYASGFPKAANMGKLVDKRLGMEREVVANPLAMKQTGQDAGKGLAGARTDNKFIQPIPVTPEAQALDGSYAGFSPKPAVEVVIVAMKPLAHGTYIDQALDNRKGVTWLDDGRIPYESERDKYEYPYGPQGKHGGPTSWDKSASRTIPQASVPSGRFPANLLVSDNAVDDGNVSKSGAAFKVSSGEGFCKTKYSGSQGLGEKTINTGIRAFGDSGGFSRYFSLDQWWQAKLSELPESVQRTFPFLVVPKAGKKEKNLGCEGLEEKQFDSSSRCATGLECNVCGCKLVLYGKTTCGHGDAKVVSLKARANIHPTVKPLKLMSYLVTLGSRPGDFVLDPFAGTCTTGMAAKMLGRNYLMIEIDEQWCRIGRRRVDAVQERML